jgi:hypothetical protein
VCATAPLRGSRKMCCVMAWRSTPRTSVSSSPAAWHLLDYTVSWGNGGSGLWQAVCQAWSTCSFGGYSADAWSSQGCRMVLPVDNLLGKSPPQFERNEVLLRQKLRISLNRDSFGLGSQCRQTSAGHSNCTLYLSPIRCWSKIVCYPSQQRDSPRDPAHIHMS